MHTKDELRDILTTKKREEVIEALRETPFSIQHSFETSGAPPGYKVYKINLHRVRCMEWDPIGRWEVLPNMVLRLTRSPCELLIMYVDGFQQKFSFQEDDYRYITEGWMVVYTKTKAQCTRA
jgi:hypothetical protein